MVRALISREEARQYLLTTLGLAGRSYTGKRGVRKLLADLRCWFERPTGL